ncbi:MAG: hypothetical protein MPJ50_06010 [Pirellulales bacterium]|nr:hypothetical protein [Pirellulales bacterium]
MKTNLRWLAAGASVLALALLIGGSALWAQETKQGNSGQSGGGQGQAQGSQGQAAGSATEQEGGQDEAEDKPYEYKKWLIKNLHNPCGLAVQPETGDVFIADSAASRVLRYGTVVNDKNTYEVTEVITGFPSDVYGKGPMYNVGPMGLLFLDKETLVVGGGGHKDGEELLRFYELPAAGGTKTADQMKFTMGPIGPGDKSETGEGNFYALAKAGDAIFVTCNGDDTKGWISRCTIQGGEPAEYGTFIATKEATQVDAPVGITTDKDGNLIVGQMGEITVPADSLLTCYNPETGEMIWNATTDRFDITAVAFNPKTGTLYCLDFGWMDESQGGLYRLDITDGDDGSKSVTSTKIETLDKPAAMAFGEDGTLFVVEFGTAKEGDLNHPGSLWRFDGLK